MKTPMVYAWCGVKQNSREILYVGKAGSGVNVRLNQHESGFKYSKTGQKNLQLLLEKTAQGYTIEFVLGNLRAPVSSSRNIFVFNRRGSLDQSSIAAMEPRISQTGRKDQPRATHPILFIGRQI